MPPTSGAYGEPQCVLTSEFCLSISLSEPLAIAARSYIGMAGLSAGSGLLINYLGQQGGAGPVGVGACLCPAYNIETAFASLGDRYPIVDRHLVGSVKQNWLQGCVWVLQ